MTVNHRPPLKAMSKDSSELVDAGRRDFSRSKQAHIL
jgi:hypothetical protein